MCIVQLVWTVHGIVPKRWRRCHICVTKMSDEMPSEREERKHILTGSDCKNDEVTHIHWPLLSSMCCTRPQTIFSKWSALTYCFYSSSLLPPLSFSWQFHIDANASVIFIAQQTNSFGMTLSPDKWEQQCRPKREAIRTKKNDAQTRFQLQRVHFWMNLWRTRHIHAFKSVWPLFSRRAEHSLCPLTSHSPTNVAYRSRRDINSQNRKRKKNLDSAKLIICIWKNSIAISTMQAPTTQPRTNVSNFGRAIDGMTV